MKTIKIYKVILCVTMMFGFSCSKDGSDGDAQNLCEMQNFGVVTINYGSSTVRHGLLITTPQTQVVREKITPIGIASDTLQLKPGAHIINIASLNEQNQAIDQEDRNVTIVQCDDNSINVTF